MQDLPKKSPFHQGEREIQARLGVREKIEDIGQRFIRDFMPDEHRAFYAQLPFLLIGSIDQAGRPWASVLVGRPGFVESPAPDRLNINAPVIFGDPLKDNLRRGLQVGLLGIDYQSRRRNRLTGKVIAIHENGLDIKIDQTFGNCPRYIQSRQYNILAEVDTIGTPRPIQTLKQLDDSTRQLISNSDHFFIATHYSENPKNASHGTDISHRGGKPGFVRINDDHTITFPDFSGNNHFNTLGNISANPFAGLLFIDFESGDLLYLTGKANIIWKSDALQAYNSAQRLVCITLDQATRVKNGMPIRWDFLEYSPSLEKTGSWQEVDEQKNARNEGNIYRDYKVVRVERESNDISSFYLQPQPDSKIHCHKAGQFLPIEIRPPGTDQHVQRTYTISNAPNGSYYRLSIKREAPAEPDLPAGLSSNYFHDYVKPGATIRAMSPRGKFILQESSTRPIVLISGGVGITPMISMLEQLANTSASCGCSRHIWFLHGARNSHLHGFADTVKNLALEWPWLNLHVRYSNPLDSDVKGLNYDSIGHIDIALIQSLLPLDDYEFYLCGPVSFMESLHNGLKSLNIEDKRIHYEYFGRGTTLPKENADDIESLAGQIGNSVPVPIRFARSGIETVWDHSKDSLLDLAESEGLKPAYSCRSGICQTCQTRIIDGEVDYFETPMVKPEPNTAFICCSYPRVKTGVHDHTMPLILDL